MKNTDKLFDFISDAIDGQDRRPKKNDWVSIILHHTGLGDRKEIDEGLWAKLHRNIAAYLAKKDDAYVSAHFQIGRNGEITQIVNPDLYVAYHAGKSSFWHPALRRFVSGMNDYAIGIELLGDGNERPYSVQQYTSLGKLVASLMERYPTIQPHCITGHETVSPGRKADPGKYFDWRLFDQCRRVGQLSPSQEPARDRLPEAG
jgi:AmpD protein